jgi:hypothetical protein
MPWFGLPGFWLGLREVGIELSYLCDCFFCFLAGRQRLFTPGWKVGGKGRSLTSEGGSMVLQVVATVAGQLPEGKPWLLQLYWHDQRCSTLPLQAIMQLPFSADARMMFGHASILEVIDSRAQVVQQTFHPSGFFGRLWCPRDMVGLCD